MVLMNFELGVFLPGPLARSAPLPYANRPTPYVPSQLPFSGALFAAVLNGEGPARADALASNASARELLLCCCDAGCRAYARVAAQLLLTCAYGDATAARWARAIEGRPRVRATRQWVQAAGFVRVALTPERCYLHCDWDCEPWERAHEEVRLPLGRTSERTLLVLLLDSTPPAPGRESAAAAVATAAVSEFWCALAHGEGCAAQALSMFQGVYAADCKYTHGRALALRLGSRALPALVVVAGQHVAPLAQGAAQLAAFDSAELLVRLLHCEDNVLVPLRTANGGEADDAAGRDAELLALARLAGASVRLNRFDLVVIEVEGVLKNQGQIVVEKVRKHDSFFARGGCTAAFFEGLLRCPQPAKAT